MKVLDAAYQVLQQAKQPLHYRDIAARATAQGLIELKTQTPEATMGSRLYMAAKRPGSLFRLVGNGTFALVESPPSDIAQRIAELNLQTRDRLRRRLHTMPADRFEALVGELLVALGFDESTVQVTSYSGDGGSTCAACCTPVGSPSSTRRCRSSGGRKTCRRPRCASCAAL